MPLDPSLEKLIDLIEHYRIDTRTPVFPFDGLFVRIPRHLLEGLLLLDASAPHVPRLLAWECAIVSVMRLLFKRDEGYLERAEALPSLAAPNNIVEQVVAYVLRGRARLEYNREGRDFERGRGELMRGAREDLDQAGALLEQHHLPREHRTAVLISAGNAWRTPPHVDPDEAIARYERAAALGITEPDEQGRLAKCHADALIMRDEPGDAIRAIALLQASLKVRRGGPFESETLLSLAQAEEAHRGLEAPADCAHIQRVYRAAQRSDGHGNAEAYARRRVEILGAWLGLEPAAKEAREALDEIRGEFPGLHQEVEFARLGGRNDHEILARVSERLNHPALHGCIEHILMIDPELVTLRGAPRDMQRFLSPQRAAELERFNRERSVAHDPVRLAALADELRDAPTDEGTPGRLVARARALVRLALFDRATVADIRRASQLADEAVARVDDSSARCFLLLHLASVWGPVDLEHPVKDFAEATRLCELAVAAAEDDEHLRIDALLHLGRATQHRTDGDLQVHRERARSIYEEILRKGPALGAENNISSARQNLGALMTSHGTGASGARSDAALVHQTAAADLGNPMGVAARAWDLTKTAERHTGNGRREILRQALALFENVPMDRLTESERLNVLNNRTVAETSMLETEGRFAESAERWRARLEDPEVQRRPDLLARTRHNLGDRLTRDARTFSEGFRLLQAALEERPLTRAPRERWETSLSIVMAILRPLEREMPWVVQMSGADAHRRAVVAARGAIAAGRRLGLGEELSRAGRYLCRLALLAERDAEFEASMEEGWRAVSDAQPCLLDDDDAAIAEARLAEAAALRVFHGRRERSVVGLLRERLEALHGEAAVAVRVWVERAMLPQQRRLAARFARPLWCDDATWRAWGDALDAAHPLDIAERVERMRGEHPDFLDPDGDDGATTAWLGASPTAAAIALLPTGEGVLAVVVAAPNVHALLLPPPPSPISSASLPDALVDVARTPGAWECVEEAAAQAREALIDPLVALVGGSLPRVRLAMGARLRWIPPSVLLPDAVVHVAPSIRRARRSADDTRRATRVALIAADPSDDLGVATAEIGRLAVELAASAEVRTALGKGTRWGRAVGVQAHGLIDRPPSPQIFFDLADGADVIVLLAHGRVIEEEGPAIELMSERGTVARLDARSIARRSPSLAGRHVVLLCCEAGFVEAHPHRLGMLLGELLACGPASVTAASWAVPIESALSVGRFVVNALLLGLEPEEGLRDAIAQQRSSAAAEGPLLGRRIDPAERQALRRAAAHAWVTWRP